MPEPLRSLLTSAMTAALDLLMMNDPPRIVVLLGLECYCKVRGHGGPLTLSYVVLLLTT